MGASKTFGFWAAENRDLRKALYGSAVKIFFFQGVYPFNLVPYSFTLVPSALLLSL